MEPKDLSFYIAAISKDYQYPETPPALSAVEDISLRLVRYLVDFLNSLHIRIPYPTHENIVTMYLMLAIFIVSFITIAMLVVLLIKGAQQNTTKPTSRTILNADAEPLLDSASWLSVANELAAESNFRSACRAVFLSTLLLLDEMGIAKFVPALSNYEYLYKLVAHKEIHSKVRELANKVDLIWFGNHDALLNDYQSCISLHDKIKRQINGQ